MNKRNVSMYAGGGGGPAEPVLSKQSVLADDVKFTAKGVEPVAERHPQCDPSDWTAEDMSGAERHPRLNPCKILAFTMAEILLSLTIIGVVAAITLPSLTGNINERTWNTQRKALYARFSQAIALMPALNGYGTLTEGDSSTSAVDTAAETFITSGLAKVLKINNICDNEHLEDCGIPLKFTTLTGSNAYSSFPRTLHDFNSMFNSSYINCANSITYTYSQLNTKAAAFETANGESILTYYNPNCQSAMNETSMYYTQPKMCANFVYDLNGSKGPNTVGKDIGFISVLYPSDSIVVAPIPILYDSNPVAFEDASAQCKNFDSESRIPNKDEYAALFYNRDLIGVDTERYCYWTGSPFSSTQAWHFCFSTGYAAPYSKTAGYKVRCVKR